MEFGRFIKGIVFELLLNFARRCTSTFLIDLSELATSFPNISHSSSSLDSVDLANSLSAEAAFSVQEITLLFLFIGISPAGGGAEYDHHLLNLLELRKHYHMKI